MVSYFIPRGRFLFKGGNLRQTVTAHQKYQQQQQLQHQQQSRWTNLRQNFSTFNIVNQRETTKIDTALIGKNNLTNSFGNVGKGDLKLKEQRHKQYHNQGKKRSAWMKWAGFFLRWAPLSICVFGAIEWRLHKEKCKKDLLPQTASQFQQKIYCSLPLRLISRCWGWIAACYMPETLRPFVYGLYSTTFKVNLEEALHTDLRHYKSLSEFFTRPLKEGVRIIDEKAPIVSPADGKVLHFGAATNSLIEQVKGVNYCIKDFLGPATWHLDNKNCTEMPYEDIIKKNRDGSTSLYQCVIYLAPGDYHRFHSPAEWKPEIRRHFTGELLSVSPKIATWFPGLFCLNERALYVGKWQHGFFSYTAVGATNVGSMQIFMDDELKTNCWNGWHLGTQKKTEEYHELSLKTDIKLKKGDLVGQFNMGSTIVLLFEAPSNFKFNIDAGQKIKVGDAIGFLN